MRQIAVSELAPAGCWDTTMLAQLFNNQLWHTGLDFKRYSGYPHNVDGCVIIIPGRYWHARGNEISEALSRYEWVLCIRSGDEEDLFDTPDRIVHPNVKHWIQTPRADRDYGEARLFGVGYTPAFTTLKPGTLRHNDVFLSAQNTHQRRQECFQALERITCKKDVHATAGFTQGMPEADYAKGMAAAKVAPAPSGAVSPDSFRLYEALQAHTIPIADGQSPAYDSTGYWQMVFPDAPFPILETYEQLPGYIVDQLGAWPANANRITSWWIGYKRRMAHWLLDDLTELGAL